MSIKKISCLGFALALVLVSCNSPAKGQNEVKAGISLANVPTSNTQASQVVDYDAIGYWTLLEITVVNGTAKEVAELHVQMNAIKECLEAIPGSLYAGDLISTEGDKVLALCGWRSKADADAWYTSPVRDNQMKSMADLGNLKVELKSNAFESYYQMVKN